MRQRLAPRATLMDVSRDRCTARESSRLATFAHAISNTKDTAPISVWPISLLRGLTPHSM